MKVKLSIFNIKFHMEYNSTERPIGSEVHGAPLLTGFGDMKYHWVISYY